MAEPDVSLIRSTCILLNYGGDQQISSDVIIQNNLRTRNIYLASSEVGEKCSVELQKFPFITKGLIRRGENTTKPNLYFCCGSNEELDNGKIVFNDMNIFNNPDDYSVNVMENTETKSLTAKLFSVITNVRNVVVTQNTNNEFEDNNKFKFSYKFQPDVINQISFSLPSLKEGMVFLYDNTGLNNILVPPISALLTNLDSSEPTLTITGIPPNAENDCTAFLMIL